MKRERKKKERIGKRKEQRGNTKSRKKRAWNVVDEKRKSFIPRQSPRTRMECIFDIKRSSRDLISTSLCFKNRLLPLYLSKLKAALNFTTNFASSVRVEPSLLHASTRYFSQCALLCDDRCPRGNTRSIMIRGQRSNL